MTWQEIYSELQKSISLLDKISFDERDLLRMANISQREIVDYTNCTKKTNSTATSTSGTGEYAKPTDYVKMLRVTYDSKPITNISKKDLDLASLRADISNPWTDDSDTPNYYYEDISTIGFYPIPDATGKTISFEYVYRCADISALTDVPFDGLINMLPYHQYLIYHVLWNIYLSLGANYLPQAQSYERNYKEGMKLIVRSMNNNPDQLITFSLIKPRRNNNTYIVPGVLP